MLISRVKSRIAEDLENGFCIHREKETQDSITSTSEINFKIKPMFQLVVV